MIPNPEYTNPDDLPFPPEDNMTWRFPMVKIPKDKCGFRKRVILKSNHAFEIVCHLDQGHDLPHEGLHRWFSGMRQ